MAKNILVLFLVFLTGRKNEAQKICPQPKAGIAFSDVSLYDSVIKTQCRYILATQLRDGAMTMTCKAFDKKKICPYFSNLACIALLKNTSPENILAVKKYMLWYFGKLNTEVNPVTNKPEIPGSIYDYYGEEETTEGTYDSIDSYAATFIILAQRFASFSDEHKQWIKEHASELTQIADAMEKCIDTENNNVPDKFGRDDNDHLSVDSYVHGAKYLMDNCEVNKALKAMVWLEQKVFEREADHYQVLVAKNTKAIEQELWRESMYNWYDNGKSSGEQSNSRWTKFYADAVCQLYPILFGIIGPETPRAKKLYSEFNQHYPDWATGKIPSKYPWAVIAYTASIMKDTTNADQFLGRILSYANTGDQMPFWYNAEAAFTILTADEMRRKVLLQNNPENVFYEKNNLFD